MIRKSQKRDKPNLWHYAYAACDKRTFKAFTMVSINNFGLVNAAREPKTKRSGPKRKENVTKENEMKIDCF